MKPTSINFQNRHNVYKSTLPHYPIIYNSTPYTQMAHQGFTPLKYAPNPSKHVTNNIMVFPEIRHGFRPVSQSSSSRGNMHNKISMENSGTQFKMKNLSFSKGSLSPNKTEISLSPKKFETFSPSANPIASLPLSKGAFALYDNQNVHPNMFMPFKSPNFNKNYLHANVPVYQSEELFKLDPKLEKEYMKKIIQIFMKMDTIRKKEIGIYKNKLIPLFQKLGLRSHRMKTLQNFLEKFLTEQKITQHDIDALNVAEKLIFMAFLVKKKYFDVDCLEFNAEVIAFFQERITVKRNEQEYKIVLKKAFKTMINAFNQEKGHYDSSKRHFYKEYFGDFAEKQSIPLEDLELENLFNEKGKKTLKKRKSKKNYAQILRTSPKFLERLSEYLDNKFAIGPKHTGSRFDAMREIRKKVPDLINKWKTRILLEEDNPPHVQMAEFLGKFFTNKKVKLPWSLHEINRAVKSVKQLLQIN